MASTMPAPSWPGVTSSYAGGVWARNFQSVGLTPERKTCTRTAPGPGSGTARSTALRTDDGPFSAYVTARIVAPRRPRRTRRRSCRRGRLRGGLLVAHAGLDVDAEPQRGPVDPVRVAGDEVGEHLLGRRAGLQGCVEVVEELARLRDVPGIVVRGRVLVAADDVRSTAGRDVVEGLAPLVAQRPGGLHRERE